MTYDIVELHRRVERLSNENMRFREFLKEGDFDIKEVDALVFEISTEVWKDVDCTKVGIAVERCPRLFPSWI